MEYAFSFNVSSFTYNSFSANISKQFPNSSGRGNYNADLSSNHSQTSFFEAAFPFKGFVLLAARNHHLSSQWCFSDQYVLKKYTGWLKKT